MTIPWGYNALLRLACCVAAFYACAPAAAFCQVEVPPGSPVEQDVKGDFFGSQQRSTVFDGPVDSQFRGITDPERRTKLQQGEPQDPIAEQGQTEQEQAAQPGPNRSTQADPRGPGAAGEAASAAEPQQPGQRSDLREKVIDRAMQDKGMLELLNRTRSIKEQIGAPDSRTSGDVPTRDYLKQAIEGIRKTADEDPAKKKTNQIAFNGPDIGGGTRPNRELAPPSVLSLIVAGQDQEHISRHTRKLARLAEHRNVKIGNVMIVGMSGVGGGVTAERGRLGRSGFVPSSAWLEQQYGQLAETGLKNYEVVLAERLFDRFDIRYSPTWVVRHLGRDYVFEGYSDPTRLFTKKGTFVRADH